MAGMFQSRSYGNGLKQAFHIFLVVDDHSNLSFIFPNNIIWVRSGLRHGLVEIISR